MSDSTFILQGKQKTVVWRNLNLAFQHTEILISSIRDHIACLSIVVKNRKRLLSQAEYEGRKPTKHVWMHCKCIKKRFLKALLCCLLYNIPQSCVCGPTINGHWKWHLIEWLKCFKCIYRKIRTVVKVRAAPAQYIYINVANVHIVINVG